ncbi:rhomboid family intramembrane serine protease [Pontimonas sp.]|nr:rhomboid family intramembrane serine protease [Pontimonas sp.]MDA8909340.1 rhomboid family intramembrane serine protease [Pontimonas sp.]
MTKRHSGAYRPAATYALLGVVGAVYAAQWLSGGTVTESLLYWPPLTAIEPWRMLTTVFVHSTASLFHILFNGFSLYVLGTLVERLIGRGRFVTLFLLAGLGGSVAVLWLAPAVAVVGASGAIFGLFGALFVIQRSFGGANVQLLIVLALNLVMGFIVPGISWQAHIGGLVVGALVAWVMVATRQSHQRAQQVGLLVAVAGALVALTALRLFA